MTADPLVTSLRELVREHGLDQVTRSLNEIRSTPAVDSARAERTAGPAGQMVPANRSRKRRTATALEQVTRLEMSEEKSEAVVELARRFDKKSLMPTFGDIARFCRLYDVSEPASKSRASAIPRVFQAIASMEVEDIQRMLDDGMFSGPSRLGPIADAIGRNSRSRVRTTEPSQSR